MSLFIVDGIFDNKTIHNFAIRSTQLRLYNICAHTVLRLKLRNGLQRIHICIFYQNINKNFPIKMLYVL